MIAKELISETVPPLKTSDSGRKALSWMHDFRVKHLPIVNNEQLLGVLSDEDILDLNKPDEPIGSYSLSLRKPYVNEYDHLFELMKLVVEQELSIIPVVDAEDNYLGVVTLESLVEFFARTGSLSEPGSIVVLEMSLRDYSLSEIARIVESENASILSTYITSQPDSTRLEVTLKLNVRDARRILASFERFEYQIKATYQEETYYDTLQERFDGLMNYLNV